MLRNGRLIWVLAGVLCVSSVLAQDKDLGIDNKDRQFYKTLSDTQRQIKLNEKRIELLEQQKKIAELTETLDAHDAAMAPPPPMPPAGQSEVHTDPVDKMTVYSVSGTEGRMQAEIRYGNGLIPVGKGDKLPGGWTVSAITVTGVRVVKGSRKRDIPMPDKVKPRAAMSTMPMPLLPPPSPTQ